MKKQAFDLMDICTDLDTEDAQLLQMFPVSRRTVLNDMLLVRTGEKIFLVKKEDVARQKKARRRFIQVSIGMSSAAFLLVAIATFPTGGWIAWGSLGMFELLLIPYLIKGVPYDFYS